MAQLGQLSLLTTSAFLCWWNIGLAQVIPSAAGLYVSELQICNYQTAIPNGANCATYGPALSQKLEAVQQGLEHYKLQYVSQNSILQDQLRRLREQVSATDSSVADLSKELKTLQTTVASLEMTASSGNKGDTPKDSSGGGVSLTNVLLENLVTTTRTQLTQRILRLENKIDSAISLVQTERRRDATEESKVDGALQAELRQQQQDLTSVLQELQRLQAHVTTLELQTPSPQTSSPTSISSTTTTTTTPLPTTTASTTTIPLTTTTSITTTDTTMPTTTTSKTSGSTTTSFVRLELQKLMDRVEQLDQNLHNNMAQLQSNVSSLQEQTRNQSRELSDVKTEVDTIYSRLIPDLKQQVDANKGKIDQLLQTKPDLTPLEEHMHTIDHNITDFGHQLSLLGTDSFDMRTQLKAEDRNITKVETEVKILASRLSNIVNQIGLTTAAPPTTTFKVPTPKLTKETSFAIPTPKPHNG